MTTQKETVKKTNFKYATASSAFTLIFLGLLLWGPLFGIGVIFGLIWMFRMSKNHRKVRILWWVILTLLLVRTAIIISVGIHKYF